MPNENDSKLPCCPKLIEDNHCDIINFSRVLTYPSSIIAANRRRIIVEVILHFKFSRCTLELTLGDPAYSTTTTLLPGEKVRLASTDRRSRFTYDGETKLSYRSEQISEEQYFMTATQNTWPMPLLRKAAMQKVLLKASGIFTEMPMEV